MKERIKELQGNLTGDLLTDSPIQQQIYELKKRLLEQSEDYETIEQVDDDVDEGCIYCSG